MTIEAGDKELFVLAALLNENGSEDGTDLLRRYWLRHDRFHFMMKVFGREPERFTLKQIQYVFEVEHVCEKLYEEMQKLLSSPICGTETAAGTEYDLEVTQSANEMVAKMETFSSLSAYRGWESFYRDASMCAAVIIREADSLLIYHNLGKNVHIRTNADTDKLFSGMTNYRQATGTYFVFEG